MFEKNPTPIQKTNRRRNRGRPPKRYRMTNGKFTKEDIFLYVPEPLFTDETQYRFLELCDNLLISLELDHLSSLDIENVAYYCRDLIISDRFRVEFYKEIDGERFDLGVLKEINKLDKQKDRYFELLKDKIKTPLPPAEINTNNDIVEYREKLYENFTKDHVYEILNEHMLFISQQENLEGLFPDLIFRDSNNNIVVVEFQLGTLDYKHLYKTCYYRDLALEKYEAPSGRAIVVCNKVQEKFQKPASKQNIEIKILQEEQFLSIVKDVDFDLYNKIDRIKFLDE